MVHFFKFQNTTEPYILMLVLWLICKQKRTCLNGNQTECIDPLFQINVILTITEQKRNFAYLKKILAVLYIWKGKVYFIEMILLGNWLEIVNYLGKCMPIDQPSHLWKGTIIANNCELLDLNLFYCSW
jgi:hypothetical protein